MVTVRNPVPGELPRAGVLTEDGHSPLRDNQPPEISRRFEALLDRVHSNRPSDDISLIRKAWDFTVKHHAGQLRASGLPYIVHPLEVAEGLAEMKLDAAAVAAGLLHDSVEDTPATHEERLKKCGVHIAHNVDGVTNIDKIQFANREDR